MSRPNADYIDIGRNSLEARPVPTPEQWTAAARYVDRVAPDLIDMLGMTEVPR